MQRENYSLSAHPKSDEVDRGRNLPVPGTAPKVLDMGDGGSVADAYDRFAPIYDDFNAGNDYEHWLGDVLLPELEKHGLKRGRVLDVGCGTGRAFVPLARRGWDITGCDASQKMLEQAMRTAGRRIIPLTQTDARELPSYQEPFDLILALNDVVNHLLGDGDLERVFDGFARNLAPAGLACFDCNSWATLSSAFTQGAEIKREGWTWRGLTGHDKPGGIYECEVSGEGVVTHVHRERHWIQGEVEEALEAAGLACRAVFGMAEFEDGAIYLLDEPDDEEHERLVYIAGRRE